MSTALPSYRAVLRTQYALRSFIPSIVGRLSLATSGLALVLQLRHTTGSFAIAGAVTAALGAANVAAIPWRARWIDRRGQPVVLASLAVGYAAGLVALGLAGANTAVLVVLGVLAGAATPPFATSMRVLWSDALPAGGLRTRAFSLDAVAGEVTYAVGPLVTALLAVLVDPLAALCLSAGGVLLGVMLFVTSPLARRRTGSRPIAGQPRPRSPLRTSGFPPVVVIMVAPGIVLGGVDIAAPAVALQQSVPLLSGVLLALFAGTSAASGLLFGRLRVGWNAERQLLVLTTVLLVVTAATGLIGGVPAALVGFALSGLCLAPVLIVGYLAGNARAEPAVRTEANSWVDTAVQLGAALGAAIVGTLTDSTSPGHALALSTVLAAVAVVVCAPSLRRHGRGVHT